MDKVHNGTAELDLFMLGESDVSIAVSTDDFPKASVANVVVAATASSQKTNEKKEKNGHT